jgi:hypothetical protein
MKRTLVRYKTKPEQAEENARLIGKVFQELQATSPDGVRYLVLRLGDGTFLHFVETADGTSPVMRPSSATIGCSASCETMRPWEPHEHIRRRRI